MKLLTTCKCFGVLLLLTCGSQQVYSQTEVDGIMMNKNQICIGPMYTYSSWDHYWEGKMKRDALNLGTVSSQSAMVMGNYGITDDLNIMAGGAYVWTKATAGTLHGVKGFQDLSVFVKWKGYKKKFGHNKISLIAIGGFSTPLSDYTVDYLPLAIGSGTTNLIGRGMIDYTWKRWSATASGTYTRRSNVDLDREEYYSDEYVVGKEIKMPDVFSYNFRAGYRGRYLIAEAVYNKMISLSGHDITRNNMPFPSNKMIAESVGVNLKYTLKFHTNLSLVGGANYVTKGRNFGQSTSYNGGIFYAFYLNKKDKKPVSNN